MQRAGYDPLQPDRVSFDLNAISDNSSQSSNIVPSDLLPPPTLSSATTQEAQAADQAVRPRRDSRSAQDLKALLRKDTPADTISQRASTLNDVFQQADHAALLSRLSLSPQASELAMSGPANLAIGAQNANAFSRFCALGQKRPPSPSDEFKLSLQTLVALRDSIKRSQKKELNQASEQYNQKAKEACQYALGHIRQSQEDRTRLDEAFSLVEEALNGDIYEENDGFLFELFVQDPFIEGMLCDRLIRFITHSIQDAQKETLLRIDLGWQQKLLRVMHNGYLIALFKKLDPHILKIRDQNYLVSDTKGERMRVKAASKDALKCINLAQNTLSQLPPNLLKLYSQLHQAILEKFSDERYADIQLAQFIFLRAINPHIAKVHKIDLYLDVDEQLLAATQYKNEQCMIISKIIQSALGYLFVQKTEKQDRLMTLKDSKSDKTLLDFVSSKTTMNVLFDFIEELKTQSSRC